MDQLHDELHQAHIATDQMAKDQAHLEADRERCEVALQQSDAGLTEQYQRGAVQAAERERVLSSRNGGP